VSNASGCGTTLKEYGHALREDGAYAEKAARISALARDVSEILAELGPAAPVIATGQRVAYHSPCSLQHGQRIRDLPKTLLEAAGFTVLEVPEGHLCCGSAGTYNMLQPELATALRDRKVANIASTHPVIVATSNIGCISQIAGGTAIPVVHMVELLDWASGGRKPMALDS
jgi:glycolate oxidase iron-sulfur subunit